MEPTSTDVDLVDESLAAQLERLLLDGATDEAPRLELAHRTTDGIEVTLLWCACHDTVSVQVFDRGADNVFELAVARQDALDAFYPVRTRVSKGSTTSFQS